MQSNVDQRWPVALSHALYRRLLVLYPSAFRSAYGAEMAQVFRDRARDAYRTHGAVGILTLWPAALRDVISAAAGEHLAQERHMARKTLPLIGGLVVLVGIFFTVVPLQVRYSVWLAISTLLGMVVYKPVFNLLLMVYGLVHSFPLALVLVTLLFQICLLPLLRKQLQTARALRTLSPQVRQLREQYRDQPQALRATQRELYRQHGVTTSALTKWLLLQILFLWALYRSFFIVILASFANHGAQGLSLINGYIYSFLPKLTSVPDMHFLWLQGAYSLGTPDPWFIVPVVVTVLTILLLRLTPLRFSVLNRTTPHRLLSLLASGLIQVLAAVLVLCFGLTFPAGLTLAWGVSLLCAVAGHIVLAGRGAWL